MVAARWFEDDFRIRAPAGFQDCFCASIYGSSVQPMAGLKLLSKFHAGEA